MWSFFCHCVIEALAGFFSSVLSKGSVIVKCCKGLGREKEVGECCRGWGSFYTKGEVKLTGTKRMCSANFFGAGSTIIGSISLLQIL